MQKENGVVTSIAADGRGEITLESGAAVPFTWDQVELPPNPESVMRHSSVGHGFALWPGAPVVYDGNHASRPVRLR